MDMLYRRNRSHSMDLCPCFGPRKFRRRGITLRTECPVPAALRMVFANIVFAAEGVFKVPIALKKRCTLRAATLSVVHAGSHSQPRFPVGTKRSTNLAHKRTKVTFLL